MLASLGAEEARAAVVDGEARVTCEFCGRVYVFTAGEVEHLLAGPVADVEPPGLLQ